MYQLVAGFANTDGKAAGALKPKPSQRPTTRGCERFRLWPSPASEFSKLHCKVCALPFKRVTSLPGAVRKLSSPDEPTTFAVMTI